ncbi:MAG: hypothetical protein PUP91_15320 [Rhizonema sp. PD37]|nr:hypothetical protein [Rhizonema sp. PD37]
MFKRSARKPEPERVVHKKDIRNKKIIEFPIILECEAPPEDELILENNGGGRSLC